ESRSRPSRQQRGRAADRVRGAGQRARARDSGRRRDPAGRARRGPRTSRPTDAVTVDSARPFQPEMLAAWLHDLESLEAISQEPDPRRLFLRMASLSQEGRLGSFLFELARDDDVDDRTKGAVNEIARDEVFLLV